MDHDAIRAAATQSLTAPAKARRAPRVKVPTRRTQVAPDAPAPRVNAVVAQRGLEPTERALEAWNQRVSGTPIIDVAHQLGVSIELAKTLINEVHAALFEDLKASMDLNRQIDLDRVDQIIKGHLPAAKAGDPEAANVVLRAIGQRAKLTGVEAESMPPSRLNSPNNILVWIQSQLPGINRIVDSLPIE